MVWFVKRLLISILLVWIVGSVVFSIIYLVPGDPAELLLSQSGSAPDPATVAALRTQLGLDQPFLQQYLQAWKGFVHGNFGYSLRDEASVGAEIAKRLPRTFELIGAAALISALVGIPFGVAAALSRSMWIDRVLSAIAGLGISIPIYVVGTGILYLLAQYWRLVPAGGFVNFSEDPVQHLILLIMPATTIAVGLSATIFRITRTAVLEIALKDYIRTARAKGVSRPRTMIHHVVRNALLPITTVFGLQLGGLLGGTVLVEYVFNWPGLSSLLVSSVNYRDYPMVVGIIMTISIVFVLLNLLIDILYGVLDPRSRVA
ncbi:ABC transporter permease [Agrobacterium vitis]|uniref:ABC transporter membrane spanning protein (Dipeptide) n=2 Tax=Rhizobium/Agrobacterium group TaxID=227290 RepID=B9K3K2_ALLAM|nr:MULTISPECIES: ABC transporter permease [Rhizobium/Agrobacterium group]ACM39450.1 ABC transporter membrane spanning protein (dipeptide) [Allorhizobium ampelinum S4]EUB99983.1 ABC-type transporter, integral membrane subunit [Rhizobium sp. CF080]MCF1449030.1 ABC transporter permease [Allorhizobium ampelinum]MCF1485226.1 ABC transporter permease [Allorhizobium ampelinum]MUO31249.1 ABC transporter permease subunit [Agrobacterium vitis]